MDFSLKLKNLHLKAHQNHPKFGDSRFESSKFMQPFLRTDQLLSGLLWMESKCKSKALDSVTTPDEVMRTVKFDPRAGEKELDRVCTSRRGSSVEASSFSLLKHKQIVKQKNQTLSPAKKVTSVNRFLRRNNRLNDIHIVEEYRELAQRSYNHKIDQHQQSTWAKLKANMMDSAPLYVSTQPPVDLQLDVVRENVSTDTTSQQEYNSGALVAVDAHAINSKDTNAVVSDSNINISKYCQIMDDYCKKLRLSYQQGTIGSFKYPIIDFLSQCLYSSTISAGSSGDSRGNSLTSSLSGNPYNATMSQVWSAIRYAFEMNGTQLHTYNSCQEFCKYGDANLKRVLSVYTAYRKSLETYYRAYMEESIKNSLIAFDYRDDYRIDPKYDEVISICRRFSQIQGLSSRGIWGEIFLLLRCGASNAAILLLKYEMEYNNLQMITVDKEDIASIVLKALITFDSKMNPTHTAQQQKQHYDEDYNTLSSADRCRLIALYDVFVEINPYARAVLMLVLNGGVNVCDVYLRVDENIQEYFWYVLCQLAYYQQNQPDMSEPGASSSMIEIRKLIDTLQDTILHKCGESYFNEDGTKPQNYVEVLILLQQYELAISYFITTNQWSDAIHMALALYHYGGLKVASSTSDSNHWSPCGKCLYTRNNNNNNKKAIVADYYIDLKKLIWSYVSSFSSALPRLAASYICCIRSKDDRLELLLKLLSKCGTNGFSQLVGGSDSHQTNQTRSEEGYLYSLLPHVEVEELVSLSVVDTVAQGNIDMAVTMSVQTGGLVQAMGLLIEQLYSELHTMSLAIITSNRISNKHTISMKATDAPDWRWRNKAVHFFKNFVISPNVSSNRSLRPVARLLQMLLNISTFYQQVFDKKYKEARVTLSKLHVVPPLFNDNSIDQQMQSLLELVSSALSTDTHGRLHQGIMDVFMNVYVIGLYCYDVLYPLEVGISRDETREQAISMYVIGFKLSLRTQGNQQFSNLFDDLIKPFNLS